MSIFAHIKRAPLDPIFGVANGFNASKLTEKYLLSVGVYCTEEGKPYVFPAVSKAEDNIIHKNFKNYLPMTGHPGFVKHARELLFGDVLPEVGDRVASIQSAAGTGALNLISEFSKKHMKFPAVLISNPAWPNYDQVFGEVGHKIIRYRYVKDCKLDLPGMLEDIRNAPTGSLVVIQAVAHNPSGVDPMGSQWDEIFETVKEYGHTIAFDFAYMGWASGDMDKDAEIIRRYAKTGEQFFVAFSFSKCMGLYGERIGCCHAVCKSPKEKVNVESRLAQALRSTISVAPQNGALIANEVLSNKQLKKQWIKELKVNAKRVIDIRGKLVDKLENYTDRDWEFIRQQRGMFALTGLTSRQVDKLAENGVFIPQNGRISVPSLNNKNVDFVARAIAKSIQ